MSQHSNNDIDPLEEFYRSKFEQEFIAPAPDAFDAIMSKTSSGGSADTVPRPESRTSWVKKGLGISIGLNIVLVTAFIWYVANDEDSGVQEEAVPQQNDTRVEPIEAPVEENNTPLDQSSSTGDQTETVLDGQKNPATTGSNVTGPGSSATNSGDELSEPDADQNQTVSGDKHDPDEDGPTKVDVVPEEGSQQKQNANQKDQKKTSDNPFDNYRDKHVKSGDSTINLFDKK